VALLLIGVQCSIIIGPLVCLVYVNDLVSLLAQCGVKVKLFSDDVKLYGENINHADTHKLRIALSVVDY